MRPAALSPVVLAGVVQETPLLEPRRCLARAARLRAHFQVRRSRPYQRVAAESEEDPVQQILWLLKTDRFWRKTELTWRAQERRMMVRVVSNSVPRAFQQAVAEHGVLPTLRKVA